MSRNFVWLLVSPAWGAEDGSSTGWFYPFLLTLGFDGEHTGRAILISLTLLVTVALIGVWAYRRIKKELRGYAHIGRGAIIDARTRWDRLASRVTGADQSPEHGFELFLKKEDPTFDLATFKSERRHDFLDARFPKCPELYFQEIRIVNALRRGNDLVARVRFEGAEFEEEWTFSRPLTPSSGRAGAWNVIEENVIRSSTAA